MSRLAKKPIVIPSNVKLQVQDVGNQYAIEAKGPKGTVKKNLANDVAISIANNEITITAKGNDNAKKPMIGTTVRTIAAMIEGVTTGFTKSLVIFGIGYKAAVKGKNLELEVGFSHPVTFPLPDGVEAKVEAQKIIFSSLNKELLGLTVQKVRDIKKPDVYKGKGFRFENENPVRKTGKKTAAK